MIIITFFLRHAVSSISFRYCRIHDAGITKNIFFGK